MTVGGPRAHRRAVPVVWSQRAGGIDSRDWWWELSPDLFDGEVTILTRRAPDQVGLSRVGGVGDVRDSGAPHVGLFRLDISRLTVAVVVMSVTARRVIVVAIGVS